MRLPKLLSAPLALLIAAVAFAGPARAALWCAHPVWAHEWGVHVFGPDGAPQAPAELPEWFYTPARPALAPSPAVRDLPADNGVRKLPVVHFYMSGPPATPIPLALEEHRAADPHAATWGRLRAGLVNPVLLEHPVGVQSSGSPCVMDRDPGVPFERVDGYTLFASEVDLLLSVWGERFFDQPGTTVVYREDVAALNTAMPLAFYTDMFHYLS